MSKLVSVWLCVCTIVHAHSTAGKNAVNQEYNTPSVNYSQLVQFVHKLPVQSTCQVNWIDIKVVVGVFTRREGVAATAMLTQELHS